MAIARLVLNYSDRPVEQYAVIDHRSGRVLFDTAEAGGLASQSRALARVDRTMDGRVFAGPDEALWSVDQRRVVWAAKDRTLEIAREADASSNALLVTECWDLLLRGLGLVPRSWGPVPQIRTEAVRDLDTGAFRYRVWHPMPLYAHHSSDGRLAVSDEGEIFELAPRVDWRLLAVCQTVLALPLVLTWLALRWRRKRRLRAAGR